MKNLRKLPDWPAGRITELVHESALLADNPWGDPCLRRHAVYLPPGYDQDQRRYPVIWYLAAYTNSGRAIANWRGFGESLSERIDRLIDEGRMGPVVVVAPDCFTTLGGNQYVDSPGIGRYASMIHEELIPEVERSFRVLPGAAHRAVVGKSSGGFAAIRFGMDYPGQWAAVGNQSGDCHFEVVMRNDFPQVASVLARHEGDPLRFLEHFWSSPGPGGAEFHTLMTLCMAASYDPSHDGRIQLPFSIDTVELDEQRWARWMEHDPIRRVQSHAGALKGLKAIYMDCGCRDQYNIHYGMRILSREMKRHGIEHHYEEFDGTHSNIDHRLDQSLPFLYRAIEAQ